MQAIIMVGGLGVRLRPLTYVIPKPLLPVGNKTILEYIIQSLSKYGFDEIFLLTYYSHEKFKQCSEYENKYKIKINMHFEGEKSGTAGGILLLRKQLNDNFLVLNGDLMVRTNFYSMFDYHLKNKADMTIGVTKYSFKVPYGVVKSDENNRLVDIIEKPEYSFIINSGIYILNGSIFEGLDRHKDYLDMPELISASYNKNKRIMTYNIGDYWLDIGQLDDYERIVDRIEEWNSSDITNEKSNR